MNGRDSENSVEKAPSLASRLRERRFNAFDKLQQSRVRRLLSPRGEVAQASGWVDIEESINFIDDTPQSSARRGPTPRRVQDRNEPPSRPPPIPPTILENDDDGLPPPVIVVVDPKPAAAATAAFSIRQQQARSSLPNKPPALQIPIGKRPVAERMESGRTAESRTTSSSPISSTYLSVAGHAAGVARSELVTPTPSAISSTASQISFIMRERLHGLAIDVQRRTSRIVAELERDDLDEAEDNESSTLDDTRRRPSLSSLVGLREEDPLEEEQDTAQELSKATRNRRLTATILPDSIDPYGHAYLCWLCIVASAFLYNSFCIPLRSSYPYQTRSNLIHWLLVDYSSDLIYLTDMIVIKPRLRFMRNGLAISAPPELRRHYLTSTLFKMDVFSVLPTEIMYFFSGPLAAWRANRLFKMPSFTQLFDHLDTVVPNPYIIRITRTFGYMIYLIHCNSCVYYLLSAWQAFGQIPYRIDNDTYVLNKWVYNNKGNAYIRCFYFTAAVATSTGNNPAPTNFVEYVYMTFSWMMGVFVFALLLGQIRDIISNANHSREEYRKVMDRTLITCHQLALPKPMVARVRDWFTYNWQQHKTLDERGMIERLPLKLQTDLALAVHYHTLSKVKLFQDCERALLRDLVLRLRPVIFLPGDMVCQKGDVGKEMYIVNQGVLLVVADETRNAQVFATLQQGSVFGEISLLAIGGNNRRTANIKAKGYATLFTLSKEDLQDVIKYYPQAHSLLRRKAAQMLRNDRKATAKEEARKRETECRLSSAIPTPKLVKIVSEVLQDNSAIGKALKSNLERSERLESMRRRRRDSGWAAWKRSASGDDDVVNNNSTNADANTSLAAAAAADTAVAVVAGAGSSSPATSRSGGFGREEREENGNR